MNTIRQEWFSNIRSDLLAGLVVALALIPEAIAFSIIAGVDPKVGLYASFCIAVVIAFTGGRPGMISAATGAMALLMVTLVKDHGLEYLFAATVLTGVLQIIAGWIRLGELMRFVSRSVVTGFVNALAILIFMAQLPELIDVPWPVYVMTAAGLGIIYGLPLVTKAVPSPLIAIIILTIISVVVGIDVRTVGDMGDLPTTPPVLLIPNLPLTLETLSIIFPYSLTLMVVGLLESLMTATIVDDLTDTNSDKSRECVGQGVANIASGFMGGMAGCAMIGQSVINIKSGGRGRLSTLSAGVFLLELLMFLGDWVSRIPMAALVAVMIMVSVSTFDWLSIKNLKSNPKSSSVVMLATVTTVVVSHNLALGVLVGVLLSGLFFASKISKTFKLSSELSINQESRVYLVEGQVFFASASNFINAFDFNEKLKEAIIDVGAAQFWDVTSVAALETVINKLKNRGAAVRVIGINHGSEKIIRKYNNSIDNRMSLSA